MLGHGKDYSADDISLRVTWNDKDGQEYKEDCSRFIDYFEDLIKCVPFEESIKRMSKKKVL